MELEILRIALAFFGCLILSYFDIFKKRNVPDAALWTFLLASAVIAFAFNGEALPFSLAVASAIGAGGYFAYKQGQLGGADVFALASLALLLPEKPALLGQAEFLKSLPFILVILYYSILTFAVCLMASKSGAILEALRRGRLKLQTAKIAEASLLVFLYCAFLFLGASAVSAPYLASLSIIFLFAVFFILFGDYLKRSAVEFLPAKEIEEEEVLALEYMDAKAAKKYSLPRLVSKEELARIKKLPIKKFAVYANLPPFIPFLLIGLLLSLLFGELFILPFAW